MKLLIFVVRSRWSFVEGGGFIIIGEIEYMIKFQGCGGGREG